MRQTNSIPHVFPFTEVEVASFCGKLTFVTLIWGQIPIYILHHFQALKLAPRVMVHHYANLFFMFKMACNEKKEI